MTRSRHSIALVVAVLALAAAALADGVPPMQVQITEREPDLFVVQWRVPSAIPAEAQPRPVLPAACAPDGPPVTTDTPGGWLHEQVYHCSGGLAGRIIAVEYPLASSALTSLVRVELLSGARHAHAFAAMESSWQVPDAGAEGLAGWLGHLQATVLAGLRHAVAHPVLLLLILALALLGGAGRATLLATAFAAGQLGGLGGAILLGDGLPHLVAQICVAVAVAFLAREARRPEHARRRLGGLAAAAGFFHGLAVATLPAVDGVWQDGLVFVVGMDAAVLVLAIIVAVTTPRLLRTAGATAAANTLLGGTAVAAALILIAAGPEPAVTAAPAPVLPLASVSGASGAGRAGRVAPAQADAPIQSFVSVEPFEVRLEALLRVQDLAGFAGVDGDSLVVSAQGAVVERLAALVSAHAELAIDGQPTQGAVDRAGFVTVDATGVLPRIEPITEALGSAIVGVTVLYPTAGMPQTVTFAWTGFDPAAPTVPATIIDPEATLAATLTADAPSLSWKNELLADPLPTVAVVDVVPATAPVPVLSLVLLLVAVALMMVLPRLRIPPAFGLAAPRIIFALALVTASLAQVTVALPGQLGSRVSPAEARRVLTGLLPGVYRAFEFRDENTVHDRLAVAVTGDALTEIYLEQRQALVMQERGGARARMEALEVPELDDLQPLDGGGFSARAVWTVSGTVTHFGHRHFRQNRYDARVGVVPVAGLWKIASIDVLGLSRVR